MNTESLESKIADLLAKAEPLRALPDDDPAKKPLTAMVDLINNLREVEAKARDAGNTAQAQADELRFAEIAADVNGPAAAPEPEPAPKRGPGRPRKQEAAAESDAPAAPAAPAGDVVEGSEAA